MSIIPLCSSSLILLLALFTPAQDKAKGGAAPADKGAAEKKLDFAKDVLPILEKNCVECHHTNDKEPKYRPKGGVILDSKEGINSSKKGKLVVAKKPEDSLLYQAVSKAADAKDRMPPAKKAEPLSKEAQETLKKWIADGAEFGTWVGAKKEAGSDKPKEGGGAGGHTPPKKGKG